MNTKDLSEIAIAKKKKKKNFKTVGKHVTTLAGVGRKLLIGKAG